MSDTPITDKEAYDVIYRDDMGCTIIATDREQCDGGSHVDSDFARTLERRAIAAEARVKELEAQKWQDIKVTKGGETYSLGTLLPMLESEIAQTRAALRLRPIDEAGPVPDGAVRLVGFIDPTNHWTMDERFSAKDTHFIDIYPPQQ